MDAANVPEGVVAALALCRAWEQLLDTIAVDWPGGPADAALDRVRDRIDAIIGTEPDGDRAPGISVRCLGPLEVRAGGREIEWPRRAKLVFTYLVVHRHRPVMRDELIEAFWPGADPDSGRNCLNVALAAVRKPFREALGDIPVVTFRSEAYRLAPGVRVSVDWDGFLRMAATGDEHLRGGERAAAAECYRSAIDLYRGPLFEDERYSPWIDPHRDDLDRAFVGVLERLSVVERDLGEHEACADTCRRLLTIEPDREEIHRRLIEMHIELGQRALAVRQLRSCERLLRMASNGGAPAAGMDLIGRVLGAGWSDARRNADLSGS